MYTTEQAAQRHRARAEELRALADNIVDPEVRTAIYQLATKYDALAARLEKPLGYKPLDLTSEPDPASS